MHARLREATRAQHEALERRSNVLGRIAAPEARRALVQGFHRLHASLEPGLARWLEPVDGLDFAGRRRAPRLDQDLRALGGRSMPDADAPAPASRAEALGWLYVLEGSTLGGRVIRKQVTAGGGDMAGLGFLDPYGAEQGERWRGFLAVVEREARTDADVDAMVAGARAAFRYAEACLAENGAVGSAADV
ncbi:MAG: biliverdin-producing heme oxygenase [Pseudomonadota bacterium]